ncbi:MAG: hypothetical protein JHC33_15365 [Ignisphaera sp.]|nr:hypothetical protein [Ignisphaera sp.]
MSEKLMESEHSESGRASGRVHQICFRVSAGEKEVWDSLARGDKLALTNFFRQVIANFASARTVIGIGVKDFAELVGILKAGYESCKDALNKCEHDLESARSENRERVESLNSEIDRLRNRVEELEKSRENLMKKLSEYEAKLAKYAQIDVGRLRLFVCSLVADPAVSNYVKELMDRYKIDYSKLCKE